SSKSILTEAQNVIYHDALEGNTPFSEDKVKTWTQAEGLFKGKIAIVFENSFHSRCAIALTDDANHFRTEDRGKTWR
ncbi:hypothetical protein BKA70DRAFT_1053636, partial [Coprinopsis sp. MPI-PUGE-AT-0042]